MQSKKKDRLEETIGKDLVKIGKKKRLGRQIDLSVKVRIEKEKKEQKELQYSHIAIDMLYENKEKK